MARFGRPRGRFFTVKDEKRRIDRDMELFQAAHGTKVYWYFLLDDQVTVDDIYDEGSVTGGKTYDGPVPMPVLSAVPQQGQESNSMDDTGFAVYDRVTLRIAYEQARRAGLDPELTKYREGRLHDRFVWRNRVFDVETVRTAGHFDQSSADTTVLVIGVQLRPDELLDSPSFAVFSG